MYGQSKPRLDGYTNADMARDLDYRKSTPCGAVSWQSKLQKCIALSTTEPEYITAIEASKEVL